MPQVLRCNGAVSGKRYKRILGNETWEYMAIYEFASEAVFERFVASDHLEELKREYDAHFADASERERFACVQVWP